jgi:hypothetical protein
LLYSAVTVVTSVLSVFRAFSGLVQRLIFGIALQLVAFARTDENLFPLGLIKDPAREAFCAVLSLHHRHTHPVLLVGVAVLSVEARLASMAGMLQERRHDKHSNMVMRETNELLGENLLEKPDAGAAAAAGTATKDGDAEKREYQKLAHELAIEALKSATPSALFIPSEIAQSCHVPSVAAIIEHYAEELVQRWRKAENKTAAPAAAASASSGGAADGRGEEEEMLGDIQMRLVQVAAGTATYTAKHAAPAAAASAESLLQYPTALQLFTELNKTRRWMRVARKIRLLLLLHFNPSLRLLRKNYLMQQKVAADKKIARVKRLAEAGAAAGYDDDEEEEEMAAPSILSTTKQAAATPESPPMSPPSRAATTSSSSSQKVSSAVDGAAHVQVTNESFALAPVTAVAAAAVAPSPAADPAPPVAAERRRAQPKVDTTNMSAAKRLAVEMQDMLEEDGASAEFSNL